MTRAIALRDRDEARRAETGTQFVSPEIPPARDRVEKEARQILYGRFPEQSFWKVHIYDVIELLESAIRKGIQIGSEKGDHEYRIPLRGSNRTDHPEPD
jgi:hypothetical protein